jgi:hypothetical protein
MFMSSQRYSSCLFILSLKTKSGKARRVENILLTFFGRVLKANDEELKDLFGELAFNLKNYEKENPDSILQGYFDYISWAESKLSGKPLSEIIKIKNQKN